MKLKSLFKSFKRSKKKTSQSTSLTGGITFKKQSLESQKEQPKYYKSIYDCPLINYDKALETGDSRYLYYREHWGKLPEKKLDQVLDDIFWEYQEESGLDDKFKMSINYKAKILDYKLQEIETGKSKKPQITRIELMLSGLKSKGEKQGLSKKLAILSKYMGYNISPNITLIEYIGIEKLYIDHAKTAVNR